MKRFILAFFLALLIFTTGCADTQPSEPQTVGEYEILSVYQYVAARTNRYGAVLGYDTKYSFTYLDSSGQLYQLNDFQHTENGLWKLRIGDENKYVIIREGYNTYHILYLTEETLRSMTAK